MDRDDAKRTDAEPRKRMFTAGRWSSRRTHAPITPPARARSYTLAVNGWPVYRTTVDDSGRVVVVGHETVEP